MQLIQLLNLFIIADIWTNITAPIVDLSNDLLGSPILVAVIIFLFFFTFIIILYIPFVAGITVLIPTLYLVFQYVEALRIVVGILIGLVIGMGLIKWLRR